MAISMKNSLCGITRVILDGRLGHPGRRCGGFEDET